MAHGVQVQQMDQQQVGPPGARQVRGGRRGEVVQVVAVQAAQQRAVASAACPGGTAGCRRQSARQARLIFQRPGRISGSTQRWPERPADGPEQRGAGRPASLAWSNRVGRRSAFAVPEPLRPLASRLEAAVGQDAVSGGVGPGERRGVQGVGLGGVDAAHPAAKGPPPQQAAEGGQAAHLLQVGRGQAVQGTTTSRRRLSPIVFRLTARCSWSGLAGRARQSRQGLTRRGGAEAWGHDHQGTVGALLRRPCRAGSQAARPGPGRAHLPALPRCLAPCRADSSSALPCACARSWPRAGWRWTCTTRRSGRPGWTTTPRTWTGRYACSGCCGGLLRPAVARAREEQWQGNWVLHPERGELDLARWLEMYVEHSETHLGYIERNLGLWKESHR